MTKKEIQYLFQKLDRLEEANDKPKFSLLSNYRFRNLLQTIIFIEVAIMLSLIIEKLITK